MTDHTQPTVTITAAHLETALRQWMARIDYDTHKNLECGEDTGQDTYPQEAADVFKQLKRITNGTPS
ncbi:hypothetical protein [Streptomyces liliifuscus]|uniref:Uncharacterized protein n=1 Tax=Streptomyces liliifuscus TaxID=2797636 RepID=A0A7T7L2H1_9ACTN|nr:hypothetical protein [Streptomyces liliifuscus]QQM45131.1 hypothetical protein JEQ17_40865 [Streptomyces liliifuscus]